MTIQISNRQESLRIHRAKLKRLAQWLMEQALQLDESLRGLELSLLLTDDEGILPLNRDYFGKSTPTDVISLLYDAMPGEKARTGEVIVNAERALQEGPRHAGVSRELALYIAHGCHHLTGATDDTPAQRDEMRSIEEGWLEQAQALDYLDGTVEEDM